MRCAPIVLFAYNRPDHLQQTVEALALNDLAKSSELFIYSDAARNETDFASVNEVRKYAKSVSGFLNVAVIEREKNYGLADSIVDGVSSLVKKFGSVIVLEDDIVTSPNFLRYMNTALEKYKNNDEVMHISGYMPPVNSSTLPESFFLKQASCWGWATWERAWSHFSRNSDTLIKLFDASRIKEFNMNGGYDYWTQVLQNHRGDKKTWAVFWYANVFMANGLCLHPSKSLVENIGFDGSGQNCNQLKTSKIHFHHSPISTFPSNTDLIIHSEASSAYRNYFYDRSYPKVSLVNRVIKKIKRVMNQL